MLLNPDGRSYDPIMMRLERGKDLHIAITVAVVLAQTIGSYFFGSGIDYSVFRASVLGTHPEALLPPYAYWLLWPLMILPHRWGLAATVFVSSALIAYTGYRLTGSGLPALLSMPGFLSAETGQIDGLIAFGILLGVHSVENEQPYLLGVGLLLMGIKPQLGAIAGIWLFLQMRDLRSLIFPMMIGIVTFLTDGLWPMELLESAGRDSLLAGAHNISLWPIAGLFLLPLILLPFLFLGQNPKRGVAISLIVTFLVMPYANFYSLDLLFAVGLPFWLVPVSYLPLLPLWPPNFSVWRIKILQALPAMGIIAAMHDLMRSRRGDVSTG
jgi:hypothetical protein